jgi:hypothetical protein
MIKKSGQLILALFAIARDFALDVAVLLPKFSPWSTLSPPVTGLAARELS